MKKSMNEIIREFKESGGKVTQCKPSYGTRQRPKSKSPKMTISSNIGREIKYV